MCEVYLLSIERRTTVLIIILTVRIIRASTVVSLVERMVEEGREDIEAWWSATLRWFSEIPAIHTQTYQAMYVYMNHNIM